MQHDLQDQWRALVAEHEAAQAAVTQAHQALAKRIEQARTPTKGLRPLQEFMEANDRAAEAAMKAKRAMERFKREHPEVG